MYLLVVCGRSHAKHLGILEFHCCLTSISKHIIGVLSTTFEMAVWAGGFYNVTPLCAVYLIFKCLLQYLEIVFKGLSNNFICQYGGINSRSYNTC